MEIPAEFNYIPNKDRIIVGRFYILNISEGGACIGKIYAINRLTGKKIFTPNKISGEKLYAVRFTLNNDDRFIESEVRCIRDYIVDEMLVAALYFRI